MVLLVRLQWNGTMNAALLSVRAPHPISMVTHCKHSNLKVKISLRQFKHRVPVSCWISFCLIQISDTESMTNTQNLQYYKSIDKLKNTVNYLNCCGNAFQDSKHIVNHRK